MFNSIRFFSKCPSAYAFNSIENVIKTQNNLSKQKKKRDLKA